MTRTDSGERATGDSAGGALAERELTEHRRGADRAPTGWIGALHLWVLSSFAFAQPVFDLLGRNAEFLVAHQADSRQVFVLAALLVFAVPVPVLLVYGLALLAGRRLRSAVFLASFWLLATLALVPVVVDLLDGGDDRAVAVAAAAGVVAAGVYWLLRPMRSALTMLAPAPLVFAGVFLLASPAAAVFAEPGRDVRPALHGATPDTPVVMIILDEFPLSSLLRADLTIDADRFPSFADLAAHSTWYRNTVSDHSGTVYAVPALLSGEAPPLGAENLPIAEHYPRTLISAAASRYRIESWEIVTELCPANACETAEQPTTTGRLQPLLRDVAILYGHIAVPERWAQALPAVDDRWAGFGEGPRGEAYAGENDVADYRRSWLQVPRWHAFNQTLQQRDVPSLYLMHTLLPHQPWFHLPSGKVYDESRKPPGIDQGEVWPDNLAITDSALRRHLLQLEFTDRLLGETLTRLRETGLFDDALLVVAADHGVSFQPGTDHRRPLDANVADISRVPLFIKVPGQQDGRIDDRPARSVDVLPTMLDVLGLRASWRMDGLSLVDPAVQVPEDRPRAIGLDHYDEIYPTPEQLSLEPTVARIHERFPAADGGVDPFAIPPAVGIMRRPVADLQVLDAQGPSAQLLGEGLTRSYDPDSDRVPALVSGAVLGAGDDDPHVVVAAVNGRVAVAGWTYPHQGYAAKFDLVLPEDLLEPGDNSIDLYLLDTGGGEQLRALSSQLAPDSS